MLLSRTVKKTSPFKTFRLKHGLTQDVIVALSGASRRAVSNWDGGTVPWPAYRINLIKALKRRDVPTAILEEAWSR